MCLATPSFHYITEAQQNKTVESKDVSFQHSQPVKCQNFVADSNISSLYTLFTLSLSSLIHTQMTQTATLRPPLLVSHLNSKSLDLSCCEGVIIAVEMQHSTNHAALHLVIEAFQRSTVCRLGYKQISQENVVSLCPLYQQRSMILNYYGFETNFTALTQLQSANLNVDIEWLPQENKMLKSSYRIRPTQPSVILLLQRSQSLKTLKVKM